MCIRDSYYTQSQAPELTEFTADKNWQTASESKPYKEPELQTTPKAVSYTHLDVYKRQNW